MNRAAQITAALVRARKAAGLAKRRRPMPRDRFPTMIVMEYTRALWKIYERVRPAFAQLEREIPSLLESAKTSRGDVHHGWDLDAGTRLDAGEGKRIRELVAQAKANMRESISDEAIEEQAREFAVRTSTTQRLQILKQTRAAFGVEIPTQDVGVAGALEAHVQANVGLIRNLTDEVAQRVEARVLAAVQGGTLAPDLARQLDEEFAFGKERAALIAVDQVGKTYSDVTRLRHAELGVRSFIWRTSRDPRVRGAPGGKYPKAIPSHFAREGKKYAYDNPPRGRNNEPEFPGKPVRCRCTPEPVFDDILDDLDDEPIPQPPPAPVEPLRPPPPPKPRSAAVAGVPLPSAALDAIRAKSA